MAMAVTPSGVCFPHKRRLLHFAFCCCSLLWLPDDLPGLLDVPASFADFRANFRFSICRSVCSLRLPLPPPRTPRGGPDHLPSMAHSFQTMGLVLREMRQRSRTAPGRSFRKLWPGAVFERGSGLSRPWTLMVPDQRSRTEKNNSPHRRFGSPPSSGTLGSGCIHPSTSST